MHVYIDANFNWNRIINNKTKVSSDTHRHDEKLSLHFFITNSFEVVNFYFVKENDSFKNSIDQSLQNERFILFLFRWIKCLHYTSIASMYRVIQTSQQKRKSKVQSRMIFTGKTCLIIFYICKFINKIAMLLVGVM